MKNKPRIEIKKSKKKKEVFVSIKAGNNKKIANSETYKNKSAAKKAINVIKKAVKRGAVDKTKSKPKKKN